MSTERDELARDIFLADNSNAAPGLMEREWDENPTAYSYAHHIADGLIAKYYRRPRQVTTVRELHALPDFSVVRSEYGAVFEKAGGWWAETGTRDKSLAVDIALPATVLHVGGAE